MEKQGKRFGNEKQKHIYKAAEYYLYKNKLDEVYTRIDVIEVYVYNRKIKHKSHQTGSRVIENKYNNIMIFIDKIIIFVYTKYIRKELIYMTTKVQKWGNSQGVRIPKIILDSVKWKENEKITIIVDGDKIIMKKAKEERKNIKELFENYKEEYEPIEIDWGEPEGEEIW